MSRRSSILPVGIALCGAVLLAGCENPSQPPAAAGQPPAAAAGQPPADAGAKPPADADRDAIMPALFY